jgi:tape measure domain-containing protein
VEGGDQTVSTVDDRVVNMRFNNSGFESGVSKTLGTLGKLKSALTFGGATKGLQQVEQAGRSFSMGNMAGAVEGVSKKFIALGTVAVTAIANITNRAVNAGIQLGKSLTIQPLIDGFHEYETQLGSIQTILANTGLSGQKGLDKVNKALNALNHYSDKTIYNFTQMARNIGTFTAAGVKLQPATQAIKGIANLAALSGSTADQASTAMYQLSQAIAANKVGLQDWNSVVNAGMGGKVFQEALFNTAKQLHTIKGVGINTTFDQWTKAGNSFRSSLQEGWITGKVLTNTLSTFTGDLTDAQLKSMGYTDQQIKAIQKQAKVAADAATKVKTITQLMDTLREAVGSGWSQTFAIIFGNFNEARDLFTNVSNVLGGFINKSSKMRNNVLKDWKALGGRTALIDGIANIFHALIAVLKPIRDAFRDIFPAKTGQDLYNLTIRFRDFMEQLKIGPKTADDLKRTFRGFFALLDIGKQIVSGIFHVIGILFDTLFQGSGHVLEFTGNVGDMLVAFDETLKKGGALTNFFDNLGKVLAVPIQFIKGIATAIGGLFDGFSQSDASGVADGIGAVGDRLSALSTIGGKIGDVFNRIGQALKPLGQTIGNALGNIGQAIANSLKNVDSQAVFSALQTGLLAGIALMIKKFFSNGINVDLGGGIFGKVGGVLDGLTNKMKAMEQEVKAKMLLEIAAAIGILTASVVALSLIKSENLQKALTAMAAGFAELLGSMKILTEIGGSAVKVPIIAAALNLIATSMLILAGSVAIFAKLGGDELKRGLIAVGTLLALITAAVIPLSKGSAGMIRAGVGINAIAVAMNILFLAVKGFSTLSWGELLKGLVAVAGSLTAIAIAMKLMPPGMALQGAGILLIAGAVNALYLAVKNFSSLSWAEMGKGLAAVAGSLTAIAIAMRLMPKGMIAQAAALAVVSGALLVLGKAIAQMGGLSFEVIGKGLGTIAGALTILAVALNAMEEALPGAAALLVAATGLRILTPVLLALGKASWSSIIKGMVTLAATFGILAAAGLLLEPVTPAILALGAAIALLGIGVGAAAAGLGLLATGLGALAAGGGAGIGILLKAIDGIIEKIPGLAVAFAKGLVQIAKIIGENAPTIIAAFGKILDQLLKLVVKEMPQIVKTIESLVDGILKVLQDKAPDIIQAGINLILDLLKGIADNIDKVVTSAVDVVVAFLESLGKQLPRMVDAGFKMVINFINGVADAIANNEPALLKAAANLATAFIRGFWNGISGLVGWIWDKIAGFFSGLWDKIKGWFGIHSPSTKAAELGINIIKGLWNGITGLAGWIWGKVSGFFSNLWGKVTDFFGMAGGLARKAVDIGIGLAKGLWNGISGLAGWVVGKVEDFISNVWQKILELPGKIAGLAVKMLKAGKDIMGSLFDGIWEALKGTGKFIEDLGKAIVNGLIDAINTLLMLPLQIPQITIPIPLAPDIHFGPYTILPQIPHLATGGLVKKKGMALVGEDGAEVVELPTGAKVYPTGTGPSIQPVLDLTNVRKQAEEMKKILSVKPEISVEVSFELASNISAERLQMAKDAVVDETSPANGPTIEIKQYNTSPKALSTVEIYRHTKNQLSMAKNALIGADT